MYKKDLNKEQASRWEDFKSKIIIDRGEKIFKDPATLGNCSVTVSFMEGKLVLELMPNETANFEGDTEGVIISINEEDCHVTSIMLMAKNAKSVEDAKKNNLPIKKFR